MTIHLFRKKKKYDNVEDIQPLTASEIEALDPDEVSSTIMERFNRHQLNKAQLQAIYRLLAKKNLEKEDPAYRLQRDKMRRKESAFQGQVDDLLKQSYMEDLQRHEDEKTQQQLQSRLDALKKGGVRTRRRRKHRKTRRSARRRCARRVSGRRICR